MIHVDEVVQNPPFSCHSGWCFTEFVVRTGNISYLFYLSG